MPFNPMALSGSERMWERYQKLEPLRDPPDDGEFVPSAAQQNQMVKICALMAIRLGNPLVRIRDIDRRLAAIFATLGIDESGDIANEVRNNGEWYSSTITFFFSLVYDRDYEMWLSLRMSFSNSMQFLRQAPSEEIDAAALIESQAKVARTVPDIRKQLDEIEAQLFPDDHLKMLIAQTEHRKHYAERHTTKINYEDPFSDF